MPNFFLKKNFKLNVHPKESDYVLIRETLRLLV